MKNKKSLYQLIIDNRYIISIIMIILATIYGFFRNSMSITQWLFTLDKVNSLWWNIKFYALLLASYELFLIITDNKKNLSVIGAIIITFSGCVQFNFTKIDSLILGEIITVLIYKVLTKDNLKINILASISIILCSIGYVFCFRPYAVAFGYVFLALIIFILLRNKEKIKDKKIILCITLISSIILSILANIFIYKNSGEIEKISFGFSGLFSYLYNCLLPFNNFENKEFLGSFISIFPLPMCLSLYYLYKNDKHIDFLLPITVVSVLGTVFCTSGFPNIIEKITLLEGVSNLRVMSAVNLANVFILFYFIANINEELFNIKNAIRITIVFIIVLAFIKYPTLFSNKKILYLFVCEFSLLLFTFLFHSDKRYKNTMLFLMVLLTMISGIPVNFFI